jgi:hypothetical protein
MTRSFQDLAARLDASADKALGQGATEDEIKAGEAALGVVIRGGFRLFLRRFGWGGAEGIDLFGLGLDVPRHLELVKTTLEERAEFCPFIPAYLLPLMNDGFGNHYCLDLRIAGDEPPVVFWDHEQDEEQVPAVDSPDFVSWFWDFLDRMSE